MTDQQIDEKWKVQGDRCPVCLATIYHRQHCLEAKLDAEAIARLTSAGPARGLGKTYGLYAKPFGVCDLLHDVLTDEGDRHGLDKAEAQAVLVLDNIRAERRERQRAARRAAFDSVQPAYSEALQRLVTNLEGIDGEALLCPDAVARALYRARVWFEGIAIQRAAGAVGPYAGLSELHERRGAADSIRDEGAGILQTLHGPGISELDTARALVRQALELFRPVDDLIFDLPETR